MKRGKKTVLLATVGDERSVKPIVFSVKQLNPNEVYLITSTSMSLYSAAIMKEITQFNDKINVVIAEAIPDDIVFKDPADVSKRIKRKIDEIKASLDEKYELIVNITGGTKPMILGAYDAGLFSESLCTYVWFEDKERPDETMQLSEFSSIKELYAYELAKSAIFYFNNQFYRVAADQFNEAKEKTLIPKKEKLYEGLFLLSKGLHTWDLFNHIAARNLIDKASEILQKYFGSTNDQRIENILQFIENSKEVLGVLEKKEECFSRDFFIFDLYKNAARKIGKGLYDDGLVRLLRLLELILQYHLFTQYDEFLTSDPDFSKFRPDKSEKIKEYILETASIPLDEVKVTFSMARKILDICGDEISQIYEEHEKDLGNLQGKRNKSILAHGCDPIDQKDAKIAQQMVEKILEAIWKTEFEELASRLTFPKLDERLAQ